MGRGFRLEPMGKRGIHAVSTNAKGERHDGEIWTEEEDKRLKGYMFAHYNVKGIAVMMGRTKAAIEKRWRVIKDKAGRTARKN